MNRLRVLLLLGVAGAALVITFKFLRKPGEVKGGEQEKVLHILSKAKVENYDPAVASADFYAINELSKIYEGLVSYHYLKVPKEIVPELAESLPHVSKDGLIYTFKIKSGVRFQDNACFPDGKGRELKAQDFVYSLMRLADPRVQSGGWQHLLGYIKGLDEWRALHLKAKGPSNYDLPIEGLKALDDNTLQFTLNRPCAHFIHVLAHPCCYVVPKEAVEHHGDQFQYNPVGTGPFQMDNLDLQASKVVYRKNPTFREKLYPSEASEKYKHLLKDAGKPLPFVDKVVTHMIPEEQPQWLQFLKGEIDYIWIPKDSFEASVTKEKKITDKMASLGLELQYAPVASTRYFGFNMRHKLFKDNPKLRQVISLAYNREEYIKLFFGGMSLVAQGIVPPSLIGYHPDYKNPYSEYNPEKAKQMLVEMGYPGGKGLPMISLDVGSSTRYRQIGEHFQKLMKAIGIKVTLSVNPWNEHIKKLNNGDFMIYQLGEIADYSDGICFLKLLFGQNTPPGSNYTCYQNPAFDKLYKDAACTLDPKGRAKVYEKLNQMVAEDVPYLYLEHEQIFALNHGWLKNYRIDIADSCDVQYLDIDLEKKKTLKGKL